MNKRRQLLPNQEVILIFDKRIGFIQQSATFKEYRSIIYNKTRHEIPVIVRSNGEEILGSDCFWILPSDIENDTQIFEIQHELIALQMKASELALSKGYMLPEKIKDKEIRDMVEQNVKYRTKLIEKLGYDPLDYSWVEKELAKNDLEKKWFKFQREEGGNFKNWEEATDRFNNSYQANIDIDTAYNMCIKWKRYLIGAWNTIASQNANIEDWKTAARKFEERHRLRQERMEQWSEKNKDKFPFVKVKKPIRFRHGPYFRECIEKIPKMFVNYLCYEIREGVVLQIVSFDIETKFIQLDFTPDIRKLIKPEETDYKPWKRIKADYDFDVWPEEIDDHLEILTIAGPKLF